MNWHQLKALIWLRWRLTVNQWRQNRGVGPWFTVILLVIFLGLAVCGTAAGLIGGALAPPDVKPIAMMVIWDVLVVAFIFFWTFSLVLELQRSEMIDQNRLMHLPVSPWGSFMLNYLLSYLSFSLALLFPGMLGLAVGLAIRRGPVMLVLVPLVMAFFFMITAWTYCLRSWLASLMLNKRRRRTVIAVVTITFILVFQLPNLLINGFSPHHRPKPSPQAAIDPEQLKKQYDAEMKRKFEVFEKMHEYIPVLWLPKAAKVSVEGRALPVIWCGLGMLGLGLLGLSRAYVTTIRLYSGGNNKKFTGSPSTEKRTKPDSKLMVERRIPPVPEQAAALAFANFQSMLRAPEVKMVLAINVVIFAIIGSGLLLQNADVISESVQPFIAMGPVFLTFMGLSQLMFNLFGFDRDGFRSLVLSPASRRNILLGKNLSLLPVAFSLFAVFLGVITILLHLRLSTILTSVFVFFGGYSTLSVIGNYVSIYTPYRIESGTLKATKMKGLTQLLIAVAQLLFPFAVLPFVAPTGLGWMCDHFDWFPGTIVMLGGSVFLAIVSAFVYWRMLGPTGDLLQRREQKILKVVAQEVE